jgi:hypothetical protein
VADAIAAARRFQARLEAIPAAQLPEDDRN